MPDASACWRHSRRFPDARADHISASLDKIHAGQTWLIRLVIGGLVAGVIAFVIRGGLNVG